MRAKTYCTALLSWTLATVTAVGVFNLLVDPLRLLPYDGIKGINAAKPMQRNHERLFKMAAVTWQQPQKVILGSSRTNRALNPSHPAFQGSKTFNLSISGTNMAETRALFEHALASAPVETAVIELDLRFFDTRKNNLDELQDYLASKDNLNKWGVAKLIAKTSLSQDTLRLSLQTLAHQDRPSEFAIDGQQTTRVFEERLARFGGIRQTIEADIQRLAPTEIERASLWKNVAANRLEFAGMKELQRIIRQARAHSVDLYLYISPSHALDQESIRYIFGWDTLEEWKRGLVRLVESERASQQSDDVELVLWDFSGYNVVTTESFPASTGKSDVMHYYWDQSHYQERVGNWVLDRMFSQHSTTDPVPEGFGVALSMFNIEAHLRRIEEEADVYRRSNPELARLVEKLCAAPTVAENRPLI